MRQQEEREEGEKILKMEMEKKMKEREEEVWRVGEARALPVVSFSQEDDGTAKVDETVLVLPEENKEKE